MTTARSSRLALVVLALLCWEDGAPQAASLDTLADDGLYTWRIAATEGAPPWCCACRGGNLSASNSCDFDNRRSDYSVSDEFRTALGEMHIYALIEAGKPELIRAVSPQCQVTSRREVVDLGMIEVEESLAWLKPHATTRATVSADALAAIAVHEGPAALHFLIDVANNGPAQDLRKDAIFWMSQARITESANELERLMFRDESSEIRRHAAFSLSQSTAANRSDALIRQGREDHDSGVRSQAWFWLAQTGASGSEEAIRWAIANDPDSRVREEAVFAASLLPGERGLNTLLAILRDGQMDRAAREQALFWLAQSESDRAFEYLDRLLSGAQ